MLILFLMSPFSVPYYHISRHNLRKIFIFIFVVHFGAWSHSKYIITIVTPLASNPQMNILHHEGLLYMK